MSDELPTDLRPVVDFFGLPNTAVVAKDFHVVRAIRALAALDAAPFALIFGGGTLPLRGRTSWCSACRKMSISKWCCWRRRP